MDSLLRLSGHVVVEVLTRLTHVLVHIIAGYILFQFGLSVCCLCICIIFCSSIDQSFALIGLIMVRQGCDVFLRSSTCTSIERCLLLLYELVGSQARLVRSKSGARALETLGGSRMLKDESVLLI